jgi:hypothetical protein
MTETKLERFQAMTPEQQSQWLRRETWKVRLMHLAGWTLISLVGLVCLLSVFKTLVYYGPLAAFFAFLLLSSAMLLPSVVRSVWQLLRTHHEEGS